EDCPPMRPCALCRDEIDREGPDICALCGQELIAPEAQQEEPEALVLSPVPPHADVLNLVNTLQQAVAKGKEERKPPRKKAASKKPGVSPAKTKKQAYRMRSRRHPATGVRGSAQALPPFITPMLAKPGEPFDDPDYLFEVKWDGTRCLAFIDQDS